MNNRYHGLDLARAVFMLLGVVFHTACIYCTDSSWRVTNTETNYIFNYIKSFIHHFRMESFYMMAGFFFVMVFEKYGLSNTLRVRIARLFIPMIVVGITLNSFMNMLSVNREFANGIEYIMQGQWLGHLWFLGNLIVYYIVSLPILLYMSRLDEKLLSNKKVLIVSLFLTPIFSSIITFLGRKIYSGIFIFITFKLLYYYFPFFLLGMLFWKIKSTVLPMLTIRNAFIFFLSFLIFLLGAKYTSVEDISYTLYKTIITFGNLCLSVSMLSLFNAFGKERNRVTEKIVDSSYSIYLLHQPLIVAAYTLLVLLGNINMYVGFITICTLCSFAIYLVHSKLFRESPSLLFLFNGKFSKPINT